jgi:hypothetical protein
MEGAGHTVQGGQRLCQQDEEDADGVWHMYSTVQYSTDVTVICKNNAYIIERS